MGIQDTQAISYQCARVIHAIKEMDLDTKFQEATGAIEYANLEVNLAKMAYKDELKKGEEMILPGS